MMDTITVTLDTGAMGAIELPRVLGAAKGLPIDFVRTSVTDRELERAATTRPSQGLILETAVVDESRVDRSVFGSPESNARRRAILALMSDNTYPYGKRASVLSKGYLHMRRDAMILNTHTNKRRDILVSKDTKAFGKPGSALRLQLESLCSTRIMTVDEFCLYCDRLRDLGQDA